MLQKKAPDDLKSLDAELKSPHALKGPRVGRVLLRLGRSLRFSRPGKAKSAAGPERKLSWLQALEKSRNQKRISPSARGRDRLRAARTSRAVAHLFPGAARVKAVGYFFCDFT
jgi:hypothetical protein